MLKRKFLFSFMLLAFIQMCICIPPKAGYGMESNTTNSHSLNNNQHNIKGKVSSLNNTQHIEGSKSTEANVSMVEVTQKSNVSNGTTSTSKVDKTNSVHGPVKGNGSATEDLSNKSSIKTSEKNITTPNKNNGNKSEVNSVTASVDNSPKKDIKVTTNKKETTQKTEENTQPNAVDQNPVIKSVSESNSKKVENDENSHFFAYLLTLMFVAIFFYLVFHNKKRIVAMIIEGKNSNNRRTRNRARYHKLDNNLEEAMNRNISEVY